jgi:hypothetical protein
MCYELLLSTTSGDDLSQFNDGGITFGQSIPDHLATNALMYPNKWYVGSRTGCSCSFRHLYEPDLGFGAPEDWFPEESSDIEATIKFIRLVRSLLAKGDRVDCVDLWEGHGDESRPPVSMKVHLGSIRDEEFRFFENHHFDFLAGQNKYV